MSENERMRGKVIAMLTVSLVPVLLSIYLKSPLQDWLPIPNTSSSRKLSTSHFPSDVVNLTRELVKFEQVEPYEYIAQWLSTIGKLNVSISKVDENRANVWATLPNVRIEDIRILLFTHMDVVSGGPKLNLYEDAKYLHGRGTTDARGILASMMTAMIKLRDEKVGLLCVTGEESTHIGIKSIREWNFRDDLILLNGEPTEGRMATSQKGILKIVVKSKGISAHSGYPELGKSAILNLIKFLNLLIQYSWDHGDTMNIGQIHGGNAPNVIPHYATATIAFRCVSQPDDILRVVTNMSKLQIFNDDIEISGVMKSSPINFYLPPNAARKYGTYKANYNTDVTSFPRKYAKAVLFGASTIHLAHTDEERILVDDLIQMPDAYIEILKELLQDVS